MLNLYRVVVALLLVRQGCAFAEEFPEPPPDVHAATEQGLQRAPASDLRAQAGTRIEKTSKGRVVKVQMNADGSLVYTDDAGGSDTGSWSVSARGGGMLCHAYSKEMGQRVCTIYFIAPDGTHYFGYDARQGTWRTTARALAR